MKIMNCSSNKIVQKDDEVIHLSAFPMQMREMETNRSLSSNIYAHDGEVYAVPRGYRTTQEEAGSWPPTPPLLEVSLMLLNDGQILLQLGSKHTDLPPKS
jgi:hypothetical protein